MQQVVCERLGKSTKYFLDSCPNQTTGAFVCHEHVHRFYSGRVATIVPHGTSWGEYRLLCLANLRRCAPQKEVLIQPPTANQYRSGPPCAFAHGEPPVKKSRTITAIRSLIMSIKAAEKMPLVNSGPSP
jgi:hypothetical protein